MIKGIVKMVQPGLIKFGKMISYDYMDVVISTEFGDLEIVHTMDQIHEDQRELVKVGSIVSGMFILTGDVAIASYKNGIVKNKKNHLALLRYTLQSGDPERLRYVLSENVEYISDNAKTTFVGIDSVIDRFKFVRKSNPDTSFFALNAKIISVDEGEEILPHKVGDDCVVIAMNDKTNYISICFIEMDKDKKISKIHITTNPRYHFRVSNK
jgi:hypothetical protein